MDLSTSGAAGALSSGSTGALPGALTGGFPAPAEARPPQAAPGDQRPPDRCGGAAGRSRLAQAVEWQVIPRLLHRHRGTEPAPPPAAGAGWLAGLALADDDSALRHAVLQLRLRGVSAEALGLDWLAPCARELGRLWERDECSFTDVTIGVGRLQRLLRQLDGDGPMAAAEVATPVPHVLLVPAPGEQHTFGVALLADHFRRAGWAVSGGADGAWIDPVARVRAERVDLVGISVGSDVRAAALPELCAVLRRASLQRGLAVVVGGPLAVRAPDRCRAETFGADAVLADARAALAWAAGRLRGTPAVADLAAASGR